MPCSPGEPQHARRVAARPGRAMWRWGRPRIALAPPRCDGLGGGRARARRDSRGGGPPGDEIGEHVPTAVPRAREPPAGGAASTTTRSRRSWSTTSSTPPTCLRHSSAYLDNNCNMAATAAAIHAHRHTVGYRLDRVKELTALDLLKSEDRERLGLGLKAQDHRAEFAPLDRSRSTFSIRSRRSTPRAERAGGCDPGQRVAAADRTWLRAVGVGHQRVATRLHAPEYRRAALFLTAPVERSGRAFLQAVQRAQHRLEARDRARSAPRRRPRGRSPARRPPPPCAPPPRRDRMC